MGLGMVVRQTLVVDVLQIGASGNIEEALCAEKITVVALAIPRDQSNGLLQLRHILIGAETVVLRATLGIETV